jgi:putative protease
LPEWEYSGLVRQWDASRGLALVEQRNHMQLGDAIEILRPNGAIFRQRLEYMTDANGTPIERAPHPQQLIWLQLAESVGDFSLIRRQRRN